MSNICHKKDEEQPFQGYPTGWWLEKLPPGDRKCLPSLEEGGDRSQVFLDLLRNCPTGDLKMKGIIFFQ